MGQLSQGTYNSDVHNYDPTEWEKKGKNGKFLTMKEKEPYDYGPFGP